MMENPSAAVPVRWRDRVAVAGFCLLLLVPVVIRSTVHPKPLPGFPPLLTKLCSISCLFTHKPDGWSSYYVQVRYPGHPRWESLDQSELFPLEPFGRRTRMHRLLGAWKAKGGPRTEDMARWVLKRHAELHPEGPRPEAVRFARSWQIPDPERPPQGHWRHPTWLEAPPQRRRVIATYRASDLLETPEQEPQP